MTHPMQVYLNTKKADGGDGEYNTLLVTLTDTLDISRPTLYRLSYPKGRQRRTLSAVKAMQLELLTEGAVPAESVNDEIDAVLDYALQLSVARSVRAIAAAA